MHHESAAIFAQVLPVMFIAIYLAGNNNTPTGMINAILTGVTLVATPPTVALMLFYVATKTDVPTPFAVIAWLTAFSLSMLMTWAAVGAMKSKHRRNTENE